MPPRPTFRQQQRPQTINTGANRNKNTTNWHKDNHNKKSEISTKIQKRKSQTRTIDPESTCYIREMMEDWQNINFIKKINFTDEKVSDINKTNRGEFWIKTNTNNQQIFWLVDTGSPRSFMNIDTAQKLLTNGKTNIKQPTKSIGEFRCFNNNKIDIIGTIQVDNKIRVIKCYKLYNTISQQEHHQHHGERHHGQTVPTSNNDDSQERWE